MRAMRKTVAEHDVAAWADAFLDELGGTAVTHDKNVKPRQRPESPVTAPRDQWAHVRATRSASSPRVGTALG